MAKIDKRVKQRLVFFEGKPDPDQLSKGQSGVNSAMVEEIKSHEIFKRRHWKLILDLMIENHFDDASIMDTESIASWTDRTYNTVWRCKNYLLLHGFATQINRNGMLGFNPDLVLVKNNHGEIVIPKLRVSF